MTAPLPTLAELTNDARDLAEQALALLRSAVDPATVPNAEVWPGMTRADLLLARARGSVLDALDRLYELDQLPARRDPWIATTGGPVDHPHAPAGEGPTPGPASGHPTPDGSSAGTGDPGAGDSFSLPVAPDVPGFSVSSGLPTAEGRGAFRPLLGAVHRLRDARSTEGYPPTFPGSPPTPPPSPAPKS